MDDGIDVDELFGDPTSLELTLPTSPSTFVLSKRLDELRHSGCSKKITWSRLGAIAYISNDGQRVYLRNVSCKPNDGSWSLTDEKAGCQIAEARSGRVFVHLCWHETGTDLAIVDSCGHILILSMSIALNVFAISRATMADVEDDGNQPIGLIWLSGNRPTHAFQKATKRDNQWVYSRFARKPSGPYHPLNKPALVCVTRSGHARLLYQNQDSKWDERNVELQSVTSSEDILTHAALMPSPGGTLVIVTYSAQANLSLYKIQIKWDSVPADLTEQRSLGSTAFQVPYIQAIHIKTEAFKLVATDNDAQWLEFGYSAINSIFSLTHLEIVSSPLDDSGEAHTETHILAVFSKSLHSFGVRQPSSGGPLSIFTSHSLEPESQSLHSCFDNTLAESRHNQMHYLLRQRVVHFEKLIISLDYFEAGNYIALTFDDGSISFLDAKTTNFLVGVSQCTIVSNLPQVGFHFFNSSSAISASFSPSGCLAAILDETHELQLCVMEHSLGMEIELSDEDQFSAVLAALALAFARACGTDSSSDDILMIIRHHFSKDAQKIFLSEVYRALPLNVDFTIEQDKLMNNPYIQKCFSMQAALGFEGSYQTRPIHASVPWFTLQLRQISILLAYFLHFNKSGSDPECYEPDILRMILGNVKWALDLAKYLVDDLFETSSYSLHESGWSGDVESLSVLLVVSSIPRSFLKYICRGLRGILSSFRNAPNINNESFEIYSAIMTLIEESPLRVDVYEKLLLSIDNVIKYTYQSAGFGAADRATPERDLLITGQVPAVLQPAVKTILISTLSQIRPDLDLLRLSTWDYSWLEIDIDRMTMSFRQYNEIDILKKAIIQLQEPREILLRPKRQCVRCCAFTEEVMPPKSLALFCLLAKTIVLRTCICGGMFALENTQKINDALVCN
ncbi:Mediator of RNA polymerase II transcription subunit 16 [Ophidiomyces ophidiicola]|nr:Mediator of RNA polymerase II transcription subunit 16 [Ophidiomyces ophidiicola]